jgi:hypothetical protein
MGGALARRELEKIMKTHRFVTAFAGKAVAVFKLYQNRGYREISMVANQGERRRVWTISGIGPT